MNITPFRLVSLVFLTLLCAACPPPGRNNTRVESPADVAEGRIP